MTLQYSVDVRNDQLDAIESTIGTAPILEIRSGAAPADCAAADSGTLLAQMTLPSDWMAAAASGAKSMSGTWQDAAANADGTAGHFRIKDSTGTTCHLQGSCGDVGTEDLVLDNASIATDQEVNVTSFQITGGNA